MASDGVDPETIERELSEQILAEHPDFDNREWVAPMVVNCLES
jgi:hypothetical protein